MEIRVNLNEFQVEVVGVLECSFLSCSHSEMKLLLGRMTRWKSF